MLGDVRDVKPFEIKQLTAYVLDVAKMRVGSWRQPLRELLLGIGKKDVGTGVV